MKKIFKNIAIASLMQFAVRTAIAQDAIALRIGDPAPALKYSKWIKGEPIASFEDGQLYVLEFWATWCGPCRTAMPHLTMLQKQYEGKISIIGVDIWEDKKKGQPYEAYLPIIEKFVNENSDNLGYSLFADNNDQHMGNNWMKAAGQEGIPSTFIVKGNKIIWIGDPMALDTILPTILEGTYNMVAYKKSFEKNVDASQMLVDEWISATKPIQESLDNKEYRRAIELIDKTRTEHPNLQFALNRMKFYILLCEVSEKEAAAFGKRWQNEDKNAAGVIVDIVSARKDLSKLTYLWAAKAYEKKGLENSPFNFHTLSTAYAKGGDFKNAIAWEGKAIKAAEAALERSKTGAMTEEILDGYKRTLAKYEANALSN